MSELDTQSQAVALPITQVTVLEDRAVVTRRAAVTLEPGRTRLRVEGVAPVLVDKTLLGTVAPAQAEADALPEGLRVRSVSAHRRWLSTEAERPEGVADLRAQIRALETQARETQQALALREGELEAVGAVRAQTIEEINEDVGWGRVEVERWERELESLDERLAGGGRARVELSYRLQDQRQTLTDLREVLAQATTLDSAAAAHLIVELINPESRPLTVELGVEYLVPGVAWRPWHTARLLGDGGEDGPSLGLRCDGAVWQATGEDWSEVELVFSTERPSLGVSPPKLADDPLWSRPRSAKVEVEARDQEVQVTGLRGELGGELGGEGSGEEGSAETRSPTVSEAPPGVDDGGEAQRLRSATRVTVPGDGRVHRVPLFDLDVPAELARVCAPERSGAVILRSRQTNAGARPLLAGPVDLVRDSGFVGRSSVPFVAPGARFELGWGPEPTLRVHRELELLEEERRTMSAWTRKPRRVTLKLSNLGPEPATLELRERVAVSETEKVEVEVLEVTGGAQPDADGFVTWSVRLPGFGHDRFSLHWVLVVHDDVVGL